MALNAGPMFKFNEAVSFFVGCETQEEIDELWAKLTADGGSPEPLRLAQGQVRPVVANRADALGRMLGDKDGGKAARAMNAMLQMEKLDLKRLQQAYEGSSRAAAAGQSSA